MRKQDLSLPVIASSGYSTDPVMSDHEKFGFQGIVRKQYGLEQLGYDSGTRCGGSCDPAAPPSAR